MASHKIASITQSSIKGPATFKISQSCHKRKCVSQTQSKCHNSESENLSPYKVQEAVYSILERSGGDLEKASQLLDERLNSTNRLISELTASSDSMTNEEFRARLTALKVQHRCAAEMTEDLRAATAAEAAALGANGHQRRKSVTFDDSKPPLPPTALASNSRGGGGPVSVPAPGSGLAGRRSMSASLEGGSWHASISNNSGAGSASCEDMLADCADRQQEDDVDERRVQQEHLRSRVKALWSDFDVHRSAVDRHRSGSLDRSWRPSSASRADSPESWRHRVTVPQPFSMTLRDEAETKGDATGEALRKSRSMRVLAEDERRRREAEEAELRVRPRAAPVPAHVYQPVLYELEKQREARRREVREHSAEILRVTEKPFSFTKRDAERKRQGRERQTEADKHRGYQRSAVGDREANIIRAKPAPPSCAAERSRQLRQEAERRREMALARAEANLRAAAMPGGMEERQRRMEAKRSARLAAQHRRSDSASGAPRVGREVPDFDRLHRQFELEMLEKQAELRVTRPEPFRLLTEQRADVAQKHTEKCLAEGRDVKANRTLYDFSLRYPTDPTDEEAAEAQEDAAAERARRRLAAAAGSESRDPEEEYRQKLRELDRKMKERDQLLSEQAKIIAQQQACARYRQSLLQAGVAPARVSALVHAYRERQLGAAGFGDFDDDLGDGFSTAPNDSEFEADFAGNLDETRFGAPSPVPN